MKISVVVPTFQRPRLLMRCLDALNRQQFNKTDYEIIVVSDGPDADTAALIEQRGEDNLRFVPLNAKRGPAAARNLGWRVARAKLIAFTDDDCVPDADWLAQMWRAFEQADLKLVAFSGKTVVPIPEVPTDYELNIAHLQTAEFITANCACTKMALTQVNGFDEKFTMAWREDSDLQFKFILAQVPILKVRTALVTHPVRNAKWGVSLKEEKKGVFNALLYKKYPSLYKKKIESGQPWSYYVVLLFLLTIFFGLLSGSAFIFLIGVAGWLTTTTAFVIRRLRRTSRALPHVAEMVVTSAVIPVLSVYYRFYGAWKYKTPLFP